MVGKEIQLNGITTSLCGNQLRIEAEVEGIEPLWFELNSEYQYLVDTESLDAFFLLYTWLAMEAGVDLTVNGKVSRRLAHALAGQVREMFFTLCPRLKKVGIHAENVSEDWFQSSVGNATGFSGGVDSWFTALKGIEGNTPFEGYFYTNTGQHGSDDASNIFYERSKLARNICLTLDKPFITINSNIDSLFKERFQQRHSISNLACALLLQHGFSQYSYAAGFTTKESAVTPHSDMAIIDSFLLPLLSTERMTFLSSGDEAGRIDKLDYISACEKFNNKLYVCTEKVIPVKNCGSCFKCRRTQIALDHLRLNKVLEESFDLKYFNRIKTLSLVGIVASSKTNASDLEIVQALSREFGIKMYHIKIMSQLWAVIKKVLPGSLRWRSMAKSPYLW